PISPTGPSETLRNQSPLTAIPPGSAVTRTEGGDEGPSWTVRSRKIPGYHRREKVISQGRAGRPASCPGARRERERKSRHACRTGSCRIQLENSRTLAGSTAVLPAAFKRSSAISRNSTFTSWWVDRSKSNWARSDATSLSIDSQLV